MQSHLCRIATLLTYQLHTRILFMLLHTLTSERWRKNRTHIYSNDRSYPPSFVVNLNLFQRTELC